MPEMDEYGNPVTTTKYIERYFENGKVVRMGNKFGLGRK